MVLHQLGYTYTVNPGFFCNNRIIAHNSQAKFGDEAQRYIDKTLQLVLSIECKEKKRDYTLKSKITDCYEGDKKQ